MNEYEEVKKEIKQIRELLQGPDWDREDRGLMGEIHDIKVALWGHPGRPNGLVGMVKEGRVIWRTIGVGVAVTVIGAAVVRFLL